MEGKTINASCPMGNRNPSVRYMKVGNKGYSAIRTDEICNKILYVSRFLAKDIDRGNPHFGQTVDGFVGHYCAYVIFPSYWKFASLDMDEMSEVTDVYGGISYKDIVLPNTGIGYRNKTVIGWDYGHGMDDERMVDKRQIGDDMKSCRTAILRYEWEVEPELMDRQYDIAIEKMEKARHDSIKKFADVHTPDGFALRKREGLL